MKKTVSRAFAIILAFLFVFQASFVAFADDEPDWQDIVLTAEEFNEILAQNPNNSASTCASGLILTYAIAIGGKVSSGSAKLVIAGETYCAPDVNKCGFTVVTIKRRTSSLSSWTTYKTYEDLYNDRPDYILSKTITVPSGYQWRVYCTHYAKKSILSKEKIDNYSNVVAIG